MRSRVLPVKTVLLVLLVVLVVLAVLFLAVRLDWFDQADVHQPVP